MSHSRTIFLFAAVALIFGTAFPAVQAGLAHFPPVLFVALRSALAAVLLLTYVHFRADYALPRTRTDVLAVLTGGALLVGGVAFRFVGQQHVTSGVAAVMFSLTPIVAAIFAWQLLPWERLSGADCGGIALGFLGVVIIFRPSPAALLDPTLLGKGLVLLSVLTGALGAVLLRRLDAPMPVVSLTAWSLAVGATLQFTAAVAVGESVGLAAVTPVSVGILLYLSVCSGVVGLVMYLGLLAETGAVRANLVSYVTPIVAIVLAWAFLGEVVSTTTLVGFATVFAGFLLLQGRLLAGHVARLRTVSN